MKMHKFIESVKAWGRRTWQFVTNDVWDIEIKSLEPGKSIGVKFVRIIHLVFHGFYKDECPMHAASLTFSTLMSIVPVLAISLALARGLGGADAAKHKVQDAVRDWTKSFSNQVVVHAPATPVVDTAVTNTSSAVTGDGTVSNMVMGAHTGIDADNLAAQINKMVETGFEKVDNISFAALGGVGLVLLLWMVISVLGRVENSFNQVWGITKGRPVWRKFTDYLSVLILLPIFIVAASSLPAADFITTHIHGDVGEAVNSFLTSAFLRRATTLLIISLCFGFTIMFMPNTKVKFSAGISGGIVAGILFIGWLWVCAAIQVGVAKYSKIYGSFAIVPIILTWVYVSWQIILFGAEVAFAVQNCSTYRMEQGSERASFMARIILALSLVLEATRQMTRTDGGFLEMEKFAGKKSVPVRLLNEVLHELVELRLLAEVYEEGGSFVLVKSPDKLKIYDVVNKIVRFGVPPEKLGLGNPEPEIEKIINKLTDGIKGKLNEITVLQVAENGG